MRMLLALGSLLLMGVVCPAQETPALRPPLAGDTAPQPTANELLAATLADLVRTAIPREYAKQEDWGSQKRITSGVKFDGLRMSRRKKEVDHGTWKQYRIVVDESQAPLSVRIEDLRPLETGQMALRLVLDARLNGWGQVRVYNRGVHVITLTGEGTSDLQVVVDCTITLRPELDGLHVDPVVTNAAVTVREFELTKLGEVRGTLARELGDGMRRVIERELDPPALTAKLNRAIDKKRDRLVITAG